MSKDWLIYLHPQYICLSLYCFSYTVLYSVSPLKSLNYFSVYSVLPLFVLLYYFQLLPISHSFGIIIPILWTLLLLSSVLFLNYPHFVKSLHYYHNLMLLLSCFQTIYSRPIVSIIPINIIFISYFFFIINYIQFKCILRLQK